MSDFEQTLTQWLLEAANHPFHLYAAIIILLTLSSFGLPFPEEVVLLTCGMIANVAIAEAAKTGNPAQVSAQALALTCFLAVLLSDLLVFWLGRRYGVKLLRGPFFGRFITESARIKIEAWTTKYGAFACGMFRFTPGIRFPGHFMCGAGRLSYAKFFLTDGIAALLTVPTQVLFMAYYGDIVLVYLKQFKIGLLVVASVAFVAWLLYRRRQHTSQPEAA